MMATSRGETDPRDRQNGSGGWHGWWRNLRCGGPEEGAKAHTLIDRHRLISLDHGDVGFLHAHRANRCLESRMREIRLYGSEGGVARKGRPYPYPGGRRRAYASKPSSGRPPSRNKAQ